jgi:hypothetical protein
VNLSLADLNVSCVERVDPPAMQFSREEALSTNTTPASVYFTAYYSTELKPQVWHTLLVYAHVPSALNDVESDSRTYLGSQAKHHRRSRGVATETIARGAEIVVVPEMPGCRFNPPQASILWLEDWHRVQFSMQSSPELPGFEMETAVNGRIAFYVGPILVAEVKFWAHLSNDADEYIADAPGAQATATSYQAVFVSYSHDDTNIVRQLEKAYRVLGLQYLRDVAILRSGEEWNPMLLKKIDEADIFQLCWSVTAKQSAYVEQEWRHAAELQRPSFIRPVYWEQPMPNPPPELNAIHFAYLKVSLKYRVWRQLTKVLLRRWRNIKQMVMQSSASTKGT